MAGRSRAEILERLGAQAGGLTSGEMRLHATVDPLGRPADRPLFLARLNSAHETGIRSPLDAAILAQPAPAARSS
jgi:Mg2+-importing ATPase